MTDCTEGYIREKNNDCKESRVLKRDDLTLMTIRMKICWKGII